MTCVYLQYLKTTKEYFYTAEEDCIVNINVCNTHSANLAVTIVAISGGESISIFNDTMSAGEVVSYTDCALKAGMQIGGLAGTASLVSVKVDLQ